MVGLTVAVVLFGASCLPAATMASADQVGSARAEVSDLQAEVTAGAARIRSATLEFDEANLQASNLALQVATDKVRITQLSQQVEVTRQALQQDAINSYTGGSATGTTGIPSDLSDPSIRAEYLQVAAGSLDDVVDEYTTQEQVIGSDESALAQAQRSTLAAIAATTRAREAALAEAAAEQVQLDSLQSRLSDLVVQSSSPAVTPSQGLPVNNGVVTVVQDIVATASPVTSVPPTPTPPVSSGGGAGGVWRQLRECESGGNYAENTGNGFFGAYQFSEQTWRGLGYPGRPDLEPASMQDQAAAKLQAEAGWGQWPACSAALGLS